MFQISEGFLCYVIEKHQRIRQKVPYTTVMSIVYQALDLLSADFSFFLQRIVHN